MPRRSQCTCHEPGHRPRPRRNLRKVPAKATTRNQCCCHQEGRLTPSPCGSLWAPWPGGGTLLLPWHWQGGWCPSEARVSRRALARQAPRLTSGPTKARNSSPRASLSTRALTHQACRCPHRSPLSVHHRCLSKPASRSPAAWRRRRGPREDTRNDGLGRLPQPLLPQLRQRPRPAAWRRRRFCQAAAPQCQPIGRHPSAALPQRCPIAFAEGRSLGPRPACSSVSKASPPWFEGHRGLRNRAPGACWGSTSAVPFGTLAQRPWLGAAVPLQSG